MEYKIIESKNYLNLQKKMNINSLLSKVLDFHHYDQKTLHTLFHPRLIYHDFSLFEESDMVLDRIHEAIENQEKICIYGDYDCDGILATTILVQAFLELGVEVGYHIPHRFEDGYGLNVNRVKQMAEKGYSLIITVDNGVKSFDAVECANELGIDVIITDHHQFDVDLPDACAFIHTKLSPDYPFKEISGGFVAYKLASALLGHQDKYLYCLAAITTISDMMPLLDENRSVVKKALTLMKEEKYQSLELLLDNKDYTTTSIGFVIAPKINSFGRLPEYCHPNILVKYFLKNASFDLRMKVAQYAKQINQKRQSLTNEQYALANPCKDLPFLYYASEDIHEGLVGLIAGKYTREYEKPSFVMHYDKKNGIYKGSARSVEGFSLHDFFMRHEDELLVYGGHALAGGFSLNEEHFDCFYHSIEDEVKNLNLHSVQEVLLIEENDLCVENIESLSLLEPFGMGNEEPLFCLKNIKILNTQQLSQGKHLKFDLISRHGKISALYFQKGALYDQVKNLQTINLIGTLSINEFRQQKIMNFIIKDIL